MRRPNLLLITPDQFRAGCLGADCPGAAGHPVVRATSLGPSNPDTTTNETEP